MIKTIIFDLGNVIVNVDKTEQYRKFSINGNKTINDVKTYIENSHHRKAFERGKLNSIQFYHKVSQELNLKMNFNEFKNAWCNIFSLNKKVENLIKKLRQSFKLILLSNTDNLHFEYIENKFKIVNTFDEYALSYKLGYRKPNPLIFLVALKKAKTLPFNCVYIDDIPEFVYIARLMGVKAFKYENFEKLVKDLDDFKIIN